MLKKVKILFCNCILIGAVSAQNLLPDAWRFKTGDDLNYAKPEFVDTTWQLIKSGATWESQGVKDYDGYAWYRTTILIPEKLKADAEKYGGLMLNLGKVDDVDYTYFNGELLGKTGDIPPNYVGKYDVERNYSISTNSIAWGKNNTIAVRVYDQSGGGGINGNAAELIVKGATDYFKIEAKFSRPDHIIIGKDTATQFLAVKNLLLEPLTGKISLEVTTDFGDKVSSESKEITLSKQSSSITGFFIKELKPGFYKAVAHLQSNLGNKSLRFSFGVNPEKIESPTDRNADFDVYWDDAKKDLAAVKPNYKLQLIDSLSKGKRNIYLVEMQSLGNIKIKAWYAVPKKAGKYPAILHVQGYSGFLKLDGMYEGDDMIALGLNIRGHGFSQDDFNPGFPGFLLSGIEEKEKYVYRGAYMDTRRAVEFLFSRPEVDTAKVAVEGGSQGGALSIATAALNNTRINLCVPHVPFLSDFKDYFRLANWPGNEFTAFVATTLPGATWDNIYNTLSYIDIKNLAPWVKCPTFMAIGLVDDVCPPHINFAAFNQITSPKSYVVYPYAGHGLPSEYSILKYKWIKKQWAIKETATEPIKAKTGKNLQAKNSKK